MVNHTKEFSVAVITHAVEKLRFEGKPEKEISTLLGIDASNIPKYKSGETKLSPTSIKLLIETYGSPKMAGGLYCQADVHSTVDDYIRTYGNKITYEFYRRMMPFINSSAFRQQLAAQISDRVLQNDADNSSRFWASTFIPKNVDGVLEWFMSQLLTEGFLKWLDKFETETLQDKEPTLLRDFEDSWRDTYVTDKFQLFIYTIGRIVATNSKKVSTWDDLFTTSIPDSISQVVLTGDVVLDLPIMSPTPAIPEFIKVYCKLGKRRDGFGLNDYKLNEELQAQANFSVSSVKVKVFLNERMQYRILVEEQLFESKRVMVIRNVRPDFIVDEVNKLVSFYKSDPLPEAKFKMAIAAKGGYIAGAEVL
jgi:hypothetical protein